MRFEYIILLIVAFNVVTAIVQRRAKKKRAEAAARASQREQIEPGEPEEEWDPEEDPRSAREAERMPSLGRDILDQLARDLGLKLPKPAPPETRASTPEPVVSEHPAHRPEQVSMPERAAPRPVLQERPAARPLPERPEPRPMIVETRAREKSHAVPRHPEAPGETRKGVTGVEAPASRKVPGSNLVPRVNLREPGKVREAFILKEILGEPVSRRPR